MVQLIRREKTIRSVILDRLIVISYIFRLEAMLEILGKPTAKSQKIDTFILDDVLSFVYVCSKLQSHLTIKFCRRQEKKRKGIREKNKVWSENS